MQAEFLYTKAASLPILTAAFFATLGQWTRRNSVGSKSGICSRKRNKQKPFPYYTDRKALLSEDLLLCLWKGTLGSKGNKEKLHLIALGYSLSVEKKSCMLPVWKLLRYGNYQRNANSLSINSTLKWTFDCIKLACKFINVCGSVLVFFPPLKPIVKYHNAFHFHNGKEDEIRN